MKHLFHSHDCSIDLDLCRRLRSNLLSTINHREHTPINLQHSTGRTLACGTITNQVTVSVDHQVSHRVTITPRIKRCQISRVVQVPHHSVSNVEDCLRWHQTSRKPENARVGCINIYHDPCGAELSLPNFGAPLSTSYLSLAARSVAAKFTMLQTKQRHWPLNKLAVGSLKQSSEISSPLKELKRRVLQLERLSHV